MNNSKVIKSSFSEWNTAEPLLSNDNVTMKIRVLLSCPTIERFNCIILAGHISQQECICHIIIYYQEPHNDLLKFRLPPVLTLHRHLGVRVPDNENIQCQKDPTLICSLFLQIVGSLHDQRGFYPNETLLFLRDQPQHYVEHQQSQKVQPYLYQGEWWEEPLLRWDCCIIRQYFYNYDLNIDNGVWVGIGLIQWNRISWANSFYFKISESLFATTTGNPIRKLVPKFY